MNQFHVLGGNEVVLHECATETAARQWIKGYTRFGDWGGYAFLTLEHYGPEENEVLETFDNPEFDE